MERSDPKISVVTLDDYQAKAAATRTAKASPEYCVLGLLEESGEVAGIFKRLVRGDYDPDVATGKLFYELGDVLWYIGQIAADNGMALSDVAQGNLDKLHDRALRKVLKGEGSDR